MRFLCIKKKTIVALLCAMIILASVVSVTVITTSSMPKPEYSIVIDAGHGGVDVKLGQYVFSKKTTYFLDMWLFLIYKHHYRLYTS